jgi:tRNA(adenine34) deaminase
VIGEQAKEINMEKFTEADNHWMKLALDEAEKAMEFGEIPVATLLVAKDKELTRGQTQVRRRESIAAHGELFALLEAKGRVWSAEKPLIIYTTLEPCLMCLGAAIQTGVDKIIYGMKAAPDGGARYVDDISRGGQPAPAVIGGLYEQAEVELMKKFLEMYPNSPAAPYVRDLLNPYQG